MGRISLDSSYCLPLLAALIFTLLLVLFGGQSGHAADRLSLMADLEYRMNKNTETNKQDGTRSSGERTVFEQQYSLDMQKEIFPTLNFNAGGMFKHDKTRSDADARSSELTDTAIRPFLGFQFEAGTIRSLAQYRKNILKESRSGRATERLFLEEYRTNLFWEPVDAPRLELDATRSLVYDEPLTTDQRMDNYQMRSRYQYQNYRFRYSHTLTDSLNKLDGATSQTNTDRGSVRYNRSLGQGKGSLNASFRFNHLQAEFSGAADRRVPTTTPGSLIGTREDTFPESSDPDSDFSPGEIDLLVELTASREQFSVGLDFTTPTNVDTLLVNFSDLEGHEAGEWSWRIFVRDSITESWRQISSVEVSTDQVESRFVLSFPRIKTRFVKAASRPIIGIGEDLFISGLAGQITLPPETSEFTSTDWTGDLSLGWQLTKDTSTGFSLLYREEHSDPFDPDKSLLSSKGRLQHIFNDVFVGRLRAEQSVTREKDEGTISDKTLSGAIAANYLETFDQNLIMSLTRLDDEDTEGEELTTVLLLRNNLLLYEGWSLVADGGISWRSAADGEESTTTFARFASNIQPNQQLNLSTVYNINWEHREDQPTRREEDGSLGISWVPTDSLSLSAEWSFTRKTDRDSETTRNRRYSVSWSPLREGTVDFSLAYGETLQNTGITTWVLTPRLSWQINRKTRFSLDYSLGEREDELEFTEFERATAGLRIFY